MRSLFSVLSTIFVMALAYWAYQENYRTQEALNEVRSLQRSIGENRENLGVLRAEWAYLNRPDRLRELVMLNYDNLELLPLTAERFGQVDQVAFPQDRLEVRDTFDVSAQGTGEEEPHE